MPECDHDNDNVNVNVIRVRPRPEPRLLQIRCYDDDGHHWSHLSEPEEVVEDIDQWKLAVDNWHTDLSNFHRQAMRATETPPSCKLYDDTYHKVDTEMTRLYEKEKGEELIARWSAVAVAVAVAHRKGRGR